MRFYKLFPIAFLALCLFAGLLGCGSKGEPDGLEARHQASAANPDEADGIVAVSPFPGQANIIPTIKAVTEFCDRPGSLAYMTRDGCRAALSRLSRDISGNLYFESAEDCRDFLQKRRDERNDIVSGHRDWCELVFANLHDRKGCHDAVPVFLGSFTEQGFCRKAPPAPKKTALPPKDAQAPYLYDYKEPGQKFDQPKTGYMPGSVPTAKKNARAAAKQSAPGKGTGGTPASGKAVTEQSAAQSSAQPAAQAAPVFVPSGQPQAVPAPGSGIPVAIPPPGAPAPTPDGQSAAPEAYRQPSAPALQGQGLGAITGPNEVSPAAVPAGVGAAAGGQMETGQAVAPQEPKPDVTPVLPLPGASVEELPEPLIGVREEVVPLPPVPSIGRIAPPLMPGVPPDTAVSDNALPAPESMPPPSPSQAASAPADAFSDIIPNFMQPPPPDPYATGAQPMPVSGMPAGQAGS